MNYLIVVAGGKGLRMGGDIPKQFQQLKGKPILMHTLCRLHQAAPEAQLVLVLPKDQQDYWRELCATHHFDVPYLLANGGETRFHSVKNGLDMIPVSESGVVGVHDGVRPFVSVQVVRTGMAEAGRHQAVIPVVPVVETVRELHGQGSRTVNRDAYRLVQTPQFFPISMLKEAYNQAYTSAFTDDASVVEALGIPVMLIEGNRENIKITTPFDKAVGEVLL